MDESNVIKVNYGPREFAKLANFRVTKEKERAEAKEDSLQNQINHVEETIVTVTYEEALDILRGEI